MHTDGSAARSVGRAVVGGRLRAERGFIHLAMKQAAARAEMSPMSIDHVEEKTEGDSSSGVSSPDEGALGVARAAHKSDDPLARGFVVAHILAGVRRLHFVGHCGRAPGSYYLFFF